MTAVQRVKGMYDILPEQAERWHWVERTAISLLEAYGYRELRLPLLERSELFARAIGEATDVVSKEMYAFEDRNGDQLALRPEGTAGCVRAMIQNGLLKVPATRIWYAGPMFRRENVQRGRNRQFYQVGAEVFATPGPDADAEQIMLLARLWRELGLAELRLELNSLGTPGSRERYRRELVAYLAGRKEQLDGDSRRRLDLNPLRVLDSKNPAMADVIANAPSLLEFLDRESREHFEALGAILDAAGIPYVVNPRLVRGLDYYTRTVFEWVTDQLGSQGTVCAGGRYDGLVAQQGGEATPAVGFAAGVDRLVELTQVQALEAPARAPHAYLVLAAADGAAAGMRFAESLRERVPGLRLKTNLGGGSFKAQFKRADRSGAGLALVLGDDELAAGTCTVKYLREEREQERRSLDELVSLLHSRVGHGPR